MGTGSPRASKLALLAGPLLWALLAATLVEEPSGGAIGVRANGASHSFGRTEATLSTRTPVVPSLAGAAAPTTTTSTTTTAPTTTSSSPPPAAISTLPPTPAPSADIGAIGSRLVLNGGIYRFVGVNAYEIATQWTVNAGCGAQLSDAQLNEFFASLPPNSLVRFWAFQGTMATSIVTKQLDWGPIDRVFAAAAAYDQRLVPVLAGQGGGCDNGHWADISWYNGGFANVYNDDPTTTDGRGLTPLSYLDYLQAIVNRYKDSPALGMWEPMSEAEASTCLPQFQPSNCSGHQTCPNEQAAASGSAPLFRRRRDRDPRTRPTAPGGGRVHRKWPVRNRLARLCVCRCQSRHRRLVVPRLQRSRSPSGG